MNRMVIRLAQIAVLLALIMLLWRAFDGRAALDHLGGANPVWLGAAAFALTLQTVLSAQRWRVTAAQLGLIIALWEALREYYLAQIVNQSLPGGVVGDAGRAVRSRSAAGLLVASQAVVFERIAGQLGLIAVLVAGLAMAGFSGALDWPHWLVTALGMGFAGTCAVAVLFAMSDRLRRSARAFSNAVWACDIRTQQIVLSLSTAMCNVAAFAFCARALGIAMPLVAVAALVPLILFAMVLPLSIGGWGIREGAAALLFPVMGASAAQGLATSVAFGLVLLATVLPGLVIPLMRPNAPVNVRTKRYITRKFDDHSAERDIR